MLPSEIRKLKRNYTAHIQELTNKIQVYHSTNEQLKIVISYQERKEKVLNSKIKKYRIAVIFLLIIVLHNLWSML